MPDLAGWRLLTYVQDGRATPGLLLGESVVDLRAVYGVESTLAVVEQWDRWSAELTARAQQMELVGTPLHAARLTAPLMYPGAIFCAAANYYDHAREMNPDRPDLDKSKARPYFFLKPPRHTVIGPDEPIPFPRASKQLDWEAEIGVVIGREAREVSEAEAMDVVAGYTIVNDLSKRDLGRRTDWQFGSDWFGQKSMDGGCPMGPWITPADQVPDPHNLKIDLWVNDQHMQDTGSWHMIFSIPEQIAYLSQLVTLRPGDVIATGTGAGVGRPRGIYLNEGDLVRTEVQQLGTLQNRVGAPLPPTQAIGKQSAGVGG